MAGLAADAVQCAIRAGKPQLAFALAEQGRAILLTEALGYRAETARLAEHAPELAREFSEWHAGASRPGDLFEFDPFERFDRQHAEILRRHPRTRGGVSAEDPFAGLRSGLSAEDMARHKSRELTRTIEKIRAPPSFERFPMAADPGSMLDHTAEGPLVLLNISRHGSSAQLFTPDGLSTVALPEAGIPALTDVVAALRGLISDIHSDRKAKEALVREELCWLWDAVTGPVLEALGITEPPSNGGTPPRIWWIPTGMLSYLPVHAAQGPRYNALDLVVSSYTPTVGALCEARSRPPHGAKHTALAVAVPDLPGAASLSNAKNEADLVAARFPNARVLTDREATSANVRAELRKASIAHFACHTELCEDSPFASTVALHDYRTSPLTVADIADQRHGNAELAFLSSCGTAEPNEQLLDAVIHLSSAFQAAGFRHVIGMLWSVGDKAGMETSKHFYANFTGSNPALALHSASLAMRADYPTFPAMWASFIHTGP